MTIGNLKTHFFAELKEIHEESEIDSFFLLLIDFMYQLRRIDLSMRPDFEIPKEDVSRWESFILDLKNEKPIQYIIGEAWFYGLRFEVNEDTLIPRPETEELVEWIIESQKSKVQSQKLEILDIGTGSGCIPISLKANLPQANVSAIDVSEKALEMSKRNAELNNVEVNFIQNNILEVGDLNQHFDIIVSNPPYVRNLEKEEIKKNVLDYEPHLALFVEDTDALLFYRKIAQLALKNLSPNGLLFFEINQYLGKETVELLENIGFKNIELKKDMYGNDRMIRCSI